MKVRDLMKDLIDLDPDAEIKIQICRGSMPDNLTYTADALSLIDYVSETDSYDILLSSDEFKNDNGGTLVDLLRQCKPTGDGITEFPEYLKSYDEEQNEL